MTHSAILFGDRTSYQHSSIIGDRATFKWNSQPFTPRGGGRGDTHKFSPDQVRDLSLSVKRRDVFGESHGK